MTRNTMANKRLLDQQRVLVTGASAGIGKAIAYACADAGAAIAVNYHSKHDEANRIVADLRQRGAHAFAMQADISKQEDCDRLFGQVQKELGGLDILVANAGVQRDAPMADMALSEWQ